jgi:predicted  nucleic acid-binding Zn-ribbon protein
VSNDVAGLRNGAAGGSGGGGADSGGSTGIGGSATPKELEQLQHEVGTLGARRAELEEVELEIMMRVDAINERITTLTSNFFNAKEQ